jgi:hypothetical protein
MTIQEIQRLKEAKPFQPFRVLTADGRHFDVRHPEVLSQTGSRRLISIAEYNSFVTLDLLLVTGVEKPIPRNGSARSRRRR